jgi:GxxExxY protein
MDLMRRAGFGCSFNRIVEALSRMAKDELLFERRTESIIGAFYEVYNRLGYGFLESVYVRALAIELAHRGHKVDAEVVVDIYYRRKHVGRHKIDQIVDDAVVVEAKAVESIPKAASRQCLSYLRAGRMKVGLVLNFGPEPQIKRVVSDGRPLGEGLEAVFPVSAGPPPAPPEQMPNTEKSDLI